MNQEIVESTFKQSVMYVRDLNQVYILLRVSITSSFIFLALK
jgi:hypothetical protein